MDDKTTTKGVISFLLLAFGIAWISWEIPIRLGLSLCIMILAVVLGVSQPDFTLKRALAMLAPGNAGALPTIPAYLWAVIPIQLLITALVATPILWGEEFGWRGYLQLRLLARRPLLAAIATGVIWGMWHLPLNIRGYNFPDHPLPGLLVFLVSTTLISIIFGWLRLHTGSIWASGLGHAATNAVGSSLTILLFAGGSGGIFRLPGSPQMDSLRRAVCVDRPHRAAQAGISLERTQQGEEIGSSPSPNPALAAGESPAR